MNRAKGGGWEFLDYLAPPRLGFTWSAGSGCDIQCAVRTRGVCWAEKIVKRLGWFCPLCPGFKPHLHDGTRGTPDRLNQPLDRKKPSVITPVSTGDLFGFPYEMAQRVLDVVEEASWHIFALLTKVPQNALSFKFTNNVWFGVTVNEQEDTWRLDELKKIQSKHKWMIAEPLYSEIDYDLTWLDWILIGNQTNPEVQPEEEWVQSILDNAEGVPIYMKSSLEFGLRLRESPGRP